jgi:phosphoribosylformylglycinamidine synthase
MPAHSQHLMHFEGGNALSAFRARTLLQALQGVNERIAGVAARHVHWVRCTEPLDAAGSDKLAGLLRYGDPALDHSQGTLVVVMPRLGTVSPWASKATDIAAQLRHRGTARRRVSVR